MFDLVWKIYHPVNDGRDLLFLAIGANLDSGSDLSLVISGCA